MMVNLPSKVLSRVKALQSTNDDKFPIHTSRSASTLEISINLPPPPPPSRNFVHQSIMILRLSAISLRYCGTMKPALLKCQRM
jgi:hypothetical protein